MKYCPMCGEKILSASAGFCNGCGLNLGDYRKKLARLANTVSAPQKINVTRPLATPTKNQPSQAIATIDGLSATDILERGIFADKSEFFKEAARYYEQAIQLGNSDAMICLGKLYESGHGFKTDESKALNLYLQASKAGNTQALLKAGLYFYENKNFDKAKEFFSAAEKAGDPEAALNLGKIYFQDNDFSKARQLFEKATAFNSLEAFYWLGELYENGDGVPQNVQKALQFYRRANLLLDRTAA